MDVKTIQPSVPSHHNFQSSIFPKIDKRVDGLYEEHNGNFDFIQPSEVSHVPCTTSCSCSHTQTEYLKTKFSNNNDFTIPGHIKRIPLQTSKYGATKLEQVRPTNKEAQDKMTQYEYESNTKLAPTDKLVEKYTEVISDYSDEKDTSIIREDELLTNEQAPPKPNTNNKNPDKNKPDKPLKTNKHKLMVADLLKLGSLGIKGLSQLAPVIEKMTGGFMKRQDNNKTTTSTTVKPLKKLTSYNANKRVDTDMDSKPSNFPIYIPVDELEASESEIYLTNVTLHQNMAWATEHKHPKAHILPPKIIHESPLVNGGIPISPGDVITANSDVIVGKPAIGGPLTLAASGIKFHNKPNVSQLDSYVSSSEQFIVKEKPPNTKTPNMPSSKVDDSYDLRPPDLPKLKQNKIPNRNMPRPSLVPPKSHILPPFIHHNSMGQNKITVRPMLAPKDNMMKTEQIKSSTNILGNHGRPAFIDYIPSLEKPYNDQSSVSSHNKPNDGHVTDSSPSSSEIVSTQLRNDGDFIIPGHNIINKPFLVDIQPSRVANVLIPHGSSTALVFAGSSEPHKTGDYVDETLPYPEPGYFGSFSIDAPQMTNVHNVPPSNNKQFQDQQYKQKPLESYKPNHSIYKDQGVKNNDLKLQWKENRRPVNDYNKIPPPTSNQETHLQVGPHITAYNPNIYNPNNGDFDKLHHVRENDKYRKDGKDTIDKDYENYLAVPPPPPQKIPYSPESKFDNGNKPYNQRPIVHTKPIQDMKIFLNIQHPVTKPTNTANQNQFKQQPQKVTSEIYFAAQDPGINKEMPIYTVHLPNNPSQSSKQEYHNSVYINNNNNNENSNDQTFTVSSQVIPNIIPNSLSGDQHVNNNKPAISYEDHAKNNMYTVTLNTAANVANRFAESGQVVGSSIPVSVGTATNNYGSVNTDIPIGTNFAIKVEENSIPFNNYNSEEQFDTIVYNKHGEVPHSVPIWDNKWNTTTNIKISKTEVNSDSNKYYESNINNQNGRPSNEHPSNVSINTPSLNSHANFPMMNEYSTSLSINTDIKPVTENVDETVRVDPKRPPKLISNIPTNSHGWYSSVPIKDLNLNKFNNINNIKVEATTRKIIPLEYSNDNIPDFGQKITTIGKPPSEFWNHNDHIIGKPFSKPKTERPYHGFVNTEQLTTKPYKLNYIPSNIGNVKQPVYDIPVRPNNNEVTTIKSTQSHSEVIKPVYENSEEIYDGEDDNEDNADEEVSLESIPVPVVSTSHTKQTTPKSSEITLLQDEIFEKDRNENKKNTNTGGLIDFDPGTQTEKSFVPENYNNIFTSNTIKPITVNDNKYYNMKPRPFTVNTITTLDHQLHQPHWQINQLWENTTNLSSEENLDLNTGEEIIKQTTTIPTTTKRYPSILSKGESKQKPPRPVFSVRPSNPVTYNDSNIITSTVHIKDKKPLIVLNEVKASTLPTFTSTSTDFEYNHSSSDIIDLSPPPPTLDYNFKPSTNDETIMGMSPPPPRTPIMPPLRPPIPTRGTVSPRPLPSRTPSPYRTKPPRTLPPRNTRPTRKPLIKDERDDISTYRPNFDIMQNNYMKRPDFNNDQPSSQLLPPPRDTSSKIIAPIKDVISPSVVNIHSASNVVFPTPISSGWLTSSGIGFSSSFDFEPTSVQLSESTSTTNLYSLTPNLSSLESYKNSLVTSVFSQSSQSFSVVPKLPEYITSTPETASTEKLDPIEYESSSENIYTISTNKYEKELDKPSTYPKTEKPEITTKKNIQKKTTEMLEEKVDVSSESQSKENSSTERIKVIPLLHTNRTRKPYPMRESDKSNINRHKSSIKSVHTIKPTRTISRPEYVLPTRQTTIRKIHPIPTRPPTLHRPSIIESSESSIDDEYIKPTEVLKPSDVPTISSSQQSNSKMEEEKMEPFIVKSISEILPTVKPTHHAGNEVKVYDEIIPTKTEFKTTVITLTKTLSEPAKTVSSIGYVNLTHTLTVTHTKTSLLSQSGGAITQTLVLTNTHTSTIVDVITEVHTQVQPTTIIETVTKHIPIVQVEPTSVLDVPTNTKVALDDISMSSEEENLIIRDSETTENVQKIDKEDENETFFVVMNKSQNGGGSPPLNTDIETPDYDGITRNEQVNNNGVSQVLFGEILLAGTPYLETTNIAHPTTGKKHIFILHHIKKKLRCSNCVFFARFRQRMSTRL